jgi:RNA polymerase sigma factor (sigma-70 family)
MMSGRVLTTELISRARAGDGEAFRELTEPYRRELQVHCYRMLGSLQDAEDVLQDTLLAAWQGLGGFEGRASIRTWLYRIATNRCLNALRSANRRPAKEWDIPQVDPASARSPARRVDHARGTRIPRERSRRHARLDRRTAAFAMGPVSLSSPSPPIGSAP